MNRLTASNACVVGLALMSFHCSDVVRGPQGGMGGTGGAAGEPGVRLDVTDIIPPDGAANISSETTVSARVNLALDPATVSVDSLRLELGSIAVPGEVTLDASGTTVTFAPETPLSLLARYTATLTGVASLDGVPLAEPVSWRFTIRDGRWGTVALIEDNDDGAAYSPQIATDPQGYAMVVWSQYDGTRFNIWSNRVTPEGSWKTAVLVETNEGGGANSPQIGMDAEGRAATVWLQSDGTRSDVWAGRFTPSGGWGIPQLVENNDDGTVYSAQIAMNWESRAIVVWYQAGATYNDIWANQYTPDAGWGTAVRIEDNENGSASVPQVAIDPEGNAVAVWQQRDGPSRYDVWANRYTPGAGWGTAELIETTDPGNAEVPQVAMDAGGSAVAVWRQMEGVDSNIASNRYTPSEGWGIPQVIDNGDEFDVFSPRVAMNARGDVVAVWLQVEEDGGRYSVWSNRFPHGEDWGAAQRIETSSDSASSPQVAIDPLGNAIAVWVASGLLANRYTTPGGWGRPQRIDSNDPGPAAPQIAFDSLGRATVVWSQRGATNADIWANQFR